MLSHISIREDKTHGERKAEAIKPSMLAISNFLKLSAIYRMLWNLIGISHTTDMVPDIAVLRVRRTGKAEGRLQRGEAQGKRMTSQRGCTVWQNLNFEVISFKVSFNQNIELAFMDLHVGKTQRPRSTKGELLGRNE